MFDQWPPKSAQELRKEAQIATKREQENLRRERLLNSRQRTLGQDVVSIREQIVYNLEAKRQEELEEKQHADAVKELTQCMRAAEISKKKERNSLDQEVKAYWAIQNKLRHEMDQRERKLYNEYCPPTDVPFCIQEDVEVLNRQVKEKQKLQASDIATQLEEKRQIEQEEKEYERRYAEISDMQVKIRTKVEETQRANRKILNIETFSANKALAKARAEKLSYEAQLDNEQKRIHVQTQEANKFLQESRTKEVGIYGKPVTYEWKGMTPSQLEEIRQEQERQKEAAKLEKEEENNYENAYAIQAENLRKAALNAEHKSRIDRHQNNLSNLEYVNYQASLAAQRKQEELEYRKKPCEIFWPFGKSAR